MIVKVCGMRDPENITQLTTLPLDWMGFILYPKSPRYIGEERAATTPIGIMRVGVTVNATLPEVKELVSYHQLHAAQLHGGESIEMCDALRNAGILVIKAISISEREDMQLAEHYAPHVDYLLFDTKCKGYGGSGEIFDWTILDSYNGTTPFLLSGGITADMSPEVAHIALHHPCMAGIDLNSRFESAPAMKDIALLDKFISEIKSIKK